MTQQPPNDDLYDERELAEIDELNRMTGENRSPLDSPWWKRIGIALAAVLLLALLIPTTLLPILEGNRGGAEESLPTTPTLGYYDFELRDNHGDRVRLSHVAASKTSVVVVFYRGYF